MRKTVVALTVIAAGVLPSTALASSSKTTTYKVGQKCTSSKDSTYAKHGLTCKDGKLAKKSSSKTTTTKTTTSKTKS